MLNHWRIQRYFTFYKLPGLGLGIAKQLARQGSHITIAARGKEALEQAVEEIKSCLKPNSNQIVQSFQVDASDYNQCLNLLKKCHASPAKSPEWVVANAGSSIPGFIADQLPQPKDQGTIMSQMLANYITAANVSQACIDFAKQSSSLDSCEDSKESRIKVCGLERDSLQHLPDRIIVVNLFSFVYEIGGFCFIIDVFYWIFCLFRQQIRIKRINGWSSI